MITVQNDWIEYLPTECVPTPVRRTAVRGGVVCAQRVPVQRRAAVGPRALAKTRPVSHRAAPAARLRLTRRGRVVLVVLPAVLALSSALVGVSAPFAQADPTAAAHTVVVHPGETLWSIAGRLAPSRDPRDVVAELERANRLRGALVLAGERLTVPADLAG